MIRSNVTSQIKDVIFFSIESYSDDRGILIELFRNDCLDNKNYPVMAYVSETKPGVTRGPHEHKEQSDLFCFVGPGDFELFLWEKKDNGGVYQEKYLVGESNPVSVIIPPGVVHAYKNISEVNGLVFNAPNKLYAGPGKLYEIDEIRHEENEKSLYQILENQNLDDSIDTDE